MTQNDRMIRQGLSFIKMHGLGNDYVYIDRFAESASFDPAALARVLADRHRGIGGDGLIQQTTNHSKFLSCLVQTSF